jgi:SNF2 family DNA or RNA helicase
MALITPLEAFKSSLIPYKHQTETMEESCNAAYWAYFMEMGTGKSAIYCAQIAYLYLNGLMDSVVIMAKAGEYANWGLYLIPELLKEGIEYECVIYSSIKAKGNTQSAALKSLMRPDHRRLRILVMNVESLQFGGDAVMKAFYASANRIMAGVDESTCIKTHDSNRSLKAYQWGDKSHYRRIMTGTPVTQSPLDLWGQARFLGKSALGFSSFYSFRNTFVVMDVKHFGQRSFKVAVGTKNLDQLNEIISQWSTQVLKEDCLDLPAKIYKKHVIEMTPQQTKLYNQMRDEALLELEGHEVEVTNVLSQLTKLHQISCGQLKVGENEYVSIENNRIPALLDILEDYPGKAIIWASYRQTLVDVVKALRKKFGKEAVVDYYGGTSVGDREYAVREMQVKGGPVRFMVANPQSAGYGLTLTEATLNIYYSNGYNLEHRLQSEDRTHRIGQTNHVTYIDFVTPDTVDERIVTALRAKKNMAAEVMRTPLRDWI